MDPVTLQVKHVFARQYSTTDADQQIRTRLFWALYTLDTALAYSQGRPPLIRLSECESKDSLSKTCS